MPLPEPTGGGFITFLEAWVGAAGTSLLAAFAGRLTYHAAGGWKRARRPIWRELLWEIPVAVTMAIIGESVASYFGLRPPISTGIVAGLAYLGPREIEHLLQWLLDRKSAD